MAKAINHVIENGRYAVWLKAYKLENEVVKTFGVSPRDLPLTNS